MGFRSSRIYSGITDQLYQSPNHAKPIIVDGKISFPINKDTLQATRAAMDKGVRGLERAYYTAKDKAFMEVPRHSEAFEAVKDYALQRRNTQTFVGSADKKAMVPTSALKGGFTDPTDLSQLVKGEASQDQVQTQQAAGALQGGDLTQLDPAETLGISPPALQPQAQDPVSGAQAPSLPSAPPVSQDPSAGVGALQAATNSTPIPNITTEASPLDPVKQSMFQNLDSVAPQDTTPNRLQNITSANWGNPSPTSPDPTADGMELIPINQTREDYQLYRKDSDTYNKLKAEGIIEASQKGVLENEDNMLFNDEGQPLGVLDPIEDGAVLHPDTFEKLGTITDDLQPLQVVDMAPEVPIDQGGVNSIFGGLF